MYENQYYMQGGRPPIIVLDGKKQQVDIYSLPATVGRNGEEVDIYLFDESVSRLHCRFDIYQGGVTITDMYSTMGTKVEKTPLTPGQQYMIESGSRLKIGKCKFKVMINQQALFSFVQQNSFESEARPQPRFSFDDETSRPQQFQQQRMNEPQRQMPNTMSSVSSGQIKEAPVRSQNISHPASMSQGDYDYDSEITEPLRRNNAIPEDIDTGGEKTEVIIFSDLEKQFKFPVKKLVDPEDGSVACVIDKTPFIVGRKAEGTDAALDVKGVSREHARFEKIDETFYITDLNSTNGVRVNGEKIQPDEQAEIKEGDIVKIGEKEYRFEQQ